jgi:hypothetical protein
MSHSRTTFQHIAASWLSMKPWVKNWLFFLNGVFIAAFAFLDDPAAKWIILAYVASSPLLAWLMVEQRGLTKLLGIAHVIPWVPLLVYIVARLSSELAGPVVTFAAEPFLASYLYLLLASLVVCLSLDLWDLVRYLRGERYVLGAPEAVHHGASRPRPARLPCEDAA